MSFYKSNCKMSTPRVIRELWGRREEGTEQAGRWRARLWPQHSGGGLRSSTAPEPQRCAAGGGGLKATAAPMGVLSPAPGHAGAQHGQFPLSVLSCWRMASGPGTALQECPGAVVPCVLCCPQSLLVSKGGPPAPLRRPLGLPSLTQLLLLAAKAQICAHRVVGCVDSN